MQTTIRKTNVVGLLAQLNVALEDRGHFLRCTLRTASDERGILYLLRDANTGFDLSDWMKSREMYNTLGVMLAMLPALEEPTDYQAMMDRLHELNDNACLAELPYRFRIEGPHGGAYSLARLDITDNGVKTLYSQPYTEQGMMRYIAMLLVNIKPILEIKEAQRANGIVLAKKVLHLNEQLARAGSPHRFRLDWLENGLCTLTRLDINDPSGEATIPFYKGQRFTAEEMIAKITTTTEQVEFMYGLLTMEVE